MDSAGDESKQNLGACIAAADAAFKNNGSLEELHALNAPRAYRVITKVLRVARLVLHAGKLDFLLLQKKVTSSKAKALQKAP